VKQEYHSLNWDIELRPNITAQDFVLSQCLEVHFAGYVAMLWWAGANILENTLKWGQYIGTYLTA
jgi:hypothetical protein